MRRKDREITDSTTIDSFIQKCHCIRLGFVDNGKAYIVPLNFGFTHLDGKRIFYFHGAKEGRKIDLMKQNEQVCFEMDTGYSLTEGPNACDYACTYQSVMGEGKVAFIDDFGDKRKALNEIMKKETGKTDWTYPDKMLEQTCVYMVEVESISCKEHT